MGKKLEVVIPKAAASCVQSGEGPQCLEISQESPFFKDSLSLGTQVH